MTLPEFLLILVMTGVILFLVYFFFRGSSGNIVMTRPIESRIDEYLDRKFDTIIDEWSLVRKPKMQKFVDQRNITLNNDEERIQKLKVFEADLLKNLAELENRVNILESSPELKESRL